ncbi:MAG: zinc ribbon domain-containing protein [Acidobacteriota bacterium]
MATVSCTNCGAQVDDTSRFCRSCGKPFDPSELTTRQLEPDIQYQSPTQIVNQSPTTPAYLSPAPLPAVPSTNDLTPRSQNRTAIVVLAATVGLLLFLLVAMLFVTLRNESTPPPPPAGAIAPLPPNPPVPPPPPAVGKSVIDESLKYPGAEETMNINNGRGKGILNLQTKDSTSKVIAWYIAKLKPTEHMNMPFGNAILRSGDIAVVINGTEDGTNILIKLGGD